MNSSASPLAAVVAGVVLCATSAARETVLVIGDSLSREYQFEFSNFPEARNWVEILAVHRPDDFYFGELETTDLGLIADVCDVFDLNFCDAIDEEGELERYRYNWAIPTASAQDYADDLAGGNFLEDRFPDFINDDFDDVDAVVVFLGGNDIDSVYSSVYNGNTSKTDEIIARIESDLEDIIDFVLDDTPSMRMVLVNVPHVGATPEVKADHPTDPIKTGRVTTALQTLDTNLRALATSKGIGYADILPLTIDLIPDTPYCIGGVPFINQGSDSGDPEYMWLGGELSQNFHPNTVGQAIVANAIIAGFNEKYGIGAEPLSEAEIVEEVVGLQTPLTEWAEGFGLPEDQRQYDDDPDDDNLINLVEFALNLDPTAPSSLPTPSMSGGSLIYEYQLRPQACEYVTTTPEFSNDLDAWSPVEAADITELPDNRFRVTLPGSEPDQFLRLSFQMR